MQKNHSLITELINIKLEWTRTRCDSASKQLQINNRFAIILSAEFISMSVKNLLIGPTYYNFFVTITNPNFWINDEIL